MTVRPPKAWVDHGNSDTRPPSFLALRRRPILEPAGIVPGPADFPADGPLCFMNIDVALRPPDDGHNRSARCQVFPKNRAKVHVAPTDAPQVDRIGCNQARQPRRRVPLDDGNARRAMRRHVFADRPDASAVTFDCIDTAIGMQLLPFDRDLPRSRAHVPHAFRCRTELAQNERLDMRVC